MLISLPHLSLIMSELPPLFMVFELCEIITSVISGVWDNTLLKYKTFRDPIPPYFMLSDYLLVMRVSV